MSPRRPIPDLLLLTAVCVFTSFIGLTSHGLTNWQEGMRAVVAREMAANHEWLVPTLHDQPYLAKPPVIYWSQRALAILRGADLPSELDLRLTVALAGWLSVLATYLVGRRLLLTASTLDPPTESQRAFADTAAFWSALFLATGVLFVRSSRIGELDILLVPSTVIAVGAIHAAWQSHRLKKQMNFGATALALFAAAIAALTKGPPGVLTLALAGYGGILLHAAISTDVNARTPVRRGLIGAAIGAIALAVFTVPNIDNIADAVGACCFAIDGALIGALLAALTDPRRARAAVFALHRTHPVGLAIAAFGVLWLWGTLTASAIGQSPVSASAAREAADNIDLLHLSSPLNNLEGASYGVGLASLSVLLGLIWLLARPSHFKAFRSISPGWFIIIAWVVLSVIAFSTLGRGTRRYLTPAWPGFALAGGLFFTLLLQRVSRPELLARAAATLALLLTLLQGWWYADGRERFNWQRSPRAFITELIATGQVGEDRLGSINFWEPAMEYYAGFPIQPIRSPAPAQHVDIDYPHPTPTLEEFAEQIQGAPYTLIIRGDRDLTEDLARLGLTATPIEIESTYLIDTRTTSVRAIQIRR